ncbi:MAG: hypothetical protein HKL83_07675, partial [Acidimicrobiaceae bacterium]|nr:hypothetical protein [Acidimicrobiaceae bacterium]
MSTHYGAGVRMLKRARRLSQTRQIRQDRQERQERQGDQGCLIIKLGLDMTDFAKVPMSAEAAAAASLSLGPPKLSADGSKVCYSASSSRGNVLFVSSVDSPLERVATPFSVRSGYFGFGGYYSFSVDSTSVFVVDSGGDLNLVDLASGSSCVIYSGGEVSDVAPSPDGSKVAFVVDQALVLLADIEGDEVDVSLIAGAPHQTPGYPPAD